MEIQQFLQAFRYYRPSGTDLVVVLFGVVALIVYLVFRHRWEKAMGELIRRRQAKNAFLTVCRGRSLLKEEISLLAGTPGKFDPEAALSQVVNNVTFDHFARDLIARATQEQLPRLNATLSAVRVKLGFRPPSRGLALASTRELPFGQFLYLVFPSDRFLEATVAEVDETKLVVTLVGSLPGKMGLLSGSPIMLHLNRAGDARYAGQAFLLKTSSDNENIYLTLSHVDNLRRDQRRQDYRVDEGRTVCMWVVEESDGGEDFRDKMENQIPERVSLDDISGGGALIIYTRELPIHQRLYINLDPTVAYGLPMVRAAVVRSTRRSGLSSWGVSVRFEDLRPSERQVIVRHVFMQEREFMKAV